MFGQTQRAGENSTQYQAGRDIVVIDEDRVREIASQTAREVIAGYAEEASAMIQHRITQLDDRTIASLIRAGRLEVFAEPAFQRTYRKALNSAAATDQETDYDLLTALLTERIESGEDRRAISGIEKAIEIIDQVDTGALRGATLLHSLRNFRATSVRLESLVELGKHYEDILDGDLPQGEEWLEHLEVLGLMRLEPARNFNPFDQWFHDKFPGLLAPGLWAGRAPTHVEGFEWLDWGEWIIPHELKPRYVRLDVESSEWMSENISITSDQPGQDSEAAKRALIDQAIAVFGVDSVDTYVKMAFYSQLADSQPFARIILWFNALPYVAGLTLAGRAVVKANILRIDSNKFVSHLL